MQPTVPDALAEWVDAMHVRGKRQFRALELEVSLVEVHLDGGFIVMSEDEVGVTVAVKVGHGRAAELGERARSMRNARRGCHVPERVGNGEARGRHKEKDEDMGNVPCWPLLALAHVHLLRLRGDTVCWTSEDAKVSASLVDPRVSFVVVCSSGYCIQ